MLYVLTSRTYSLLPLSLLPLLIQSRSSPLLPITAGSHNRKDFHNSLNPSQFIVLYPVSAKKCIWAPLEVMGMSVMAMSPNMRYHYD